MEETRFEIVNMLSYTTNRADKSYRVNTALVDYTEKFKKYSSEKKTYKISYFKKVLS